MGKHTLYNRLIVLDDSSIGSATGLGSARLQVVGSTDDNTAYALKIKDSLDVELFSVRNDHKIFATVDDQQFRIISTSPAATNALEIFDTNYGNIFGIEGVYGRVKLGAGYITSPATLNLSDYGTVQRYINFETDGSHGYISRSSTGLIFTGLDTVDGVQFILNSDLSLNDTTAYFKNKVGIGTTTPTANLEIQGTLKFVDGNQASGYVLTSDASGVATWQAPGGGGGSSPVPITYVALAALQSGATMVPGTLYYITDRDLGIYVTAITETEIDTRGVRVMLTPKHDAIANANLIGVWYSWIDTVIPLSAGLQVIWGGQVWTNLTGAVGTAVDDVTLDGTNWSLEAKGVGEDAYYGIVTHGIEYDLRQDLIIKQWDNLGNIVGPVTKAEETTFGFNPTTITQWLAFKDVDYIWNGGAYGDWYTIFYNNTSKYGFYNIANLDFLSGGPANFNNSSYTYCKNFTTIEFGIIEKNKNCSIYNNDGPIISYFYLNNNVNVYNNTTLPGTSFDHIQCQESSTNDCSDTVTQSLNTYVRIGNLTTPVSVNYSNAILVSGCIAIGNISYCENLSFTGVEYPGFDKVRFPNEFVVPAGLNAAQDVINYEKSSGKEINVYVEYGSLQSATVSAKYSSQIMENNTRMVEAVATIINASVATGTPLIEWGVETDAETYLTPTDPISIQTDPVKITNITSLLTLGKRFRVKINGGTLTSAVPPNDPRLRVWVKLITY